MTAPSTSIIIVGYNSRDYVNACLSSVLAQEYPGPCEIIFVDNASADGSADFVREHFPGVSVIESGANLGYAGGNNLGARQAIGEVLVFLNPDTRAEPGWLVELIRPLTVDATVGMTTSKIVLMDDPATINACGNDISLAGITTCRRAGQPAASVVEDEDVTAVSGASCAIRAGLFHTLGGFDERFWMYLEDTDLSWRVRRAGYRCRCVAKSTVAHRYALSVSASKTYGIERNRYFMLFKNLRVPSLVTLAPHLFIAEMVTLGWALLNGRDHARAKFAATSHILSNVGRLVRSGSSARLSARVSDYRLLRQHPVSLALRTIAPSAIARYSGFFLVPLFTCTAFLAFACLSVLTMLGAGQPGASLESPGPGV